MIDESSPSMKKAPAIVIGTISGTFACGVSSLVASDSATIRACFHPSASMTSFEGYEWSMGGTPLSVKRAQWRGFRRFEIAGTPLYMIVSTERRRDLEARTGRIRKQFVCESCTTHERSAHRSRAHRHPHGGARHQSLHLRAARRRTASGRDAGRPYRADPAQRRRAPVLAHPLRAEL